MKKRSVGLAVLSVAAMTALTLGTTSKTDVKAASGVRPRYM